MKKLLVLLLALPALALGSPVNVQKDSATNQLLYSGFKVPTGDTIELQSGSTFLIDSGATFTFPSGSVLWSSISGTPTTLSGYGITNGQILNANLTAISGLTSSANTIPYFTGSGTAALNNFTSIGQALAAAVSAASAQSTLALTPGTNVQAYSATLAAVAGGTYVGAASITTLGTVTTGTWNASPINLASYVTGTLPSTNGGTASAFFAVSGPASSIKTFTFPNASANVLTDNAVVTPAQGGSGVNNGGATETRGGNVTFSGAYTSTLTLTNNTNVTLPITGTLATLSNAEALTNKTVNGLTPTALTTGFSIAGGTSSKTLTVSNSLTLAGTDSSTLNIGGGGTLGTAAFTNTGAYEVPLTFSTGLTRTVNTVTVNASQSISTLSNLTGNGVVQTSGGTGALSINTPTGSGSVVEATAPTIAGGSISGLTTLGIRDTSAAFDVVVGATSSTTLTANRALTLDVGNVARTLKFTGNAVLNQDVSSTGAPTFGATTVASLSLGATTPGVIAGSSGALTLTGAGTNQNITISPSGTGAVVFNVGAAATPALAFAGDTSTGLYHPASTQIGFTVSGISVGYITGTGLNAMTIGNVTPEPGSFTTLGASGIASFTSIGNAVQLINNASYSALDSLATSRGLLKLDASNNVVLAPAGAGINSVLINLNGVTQGTFTSTGIQGAIGATTPSTGAFTTLAASGLFTAANGSDAAPSIEFTGATTTGLYWGNPGIGFSVGGTSVGTMTSTGLNGMAIGATTQAAASFTTLSASGTSTLTGNVGIGIAAQAYTPLYVRSANASGQYAAYFQGGTGSGNSFGVTIGGGTNSSDLALRVMEQTLTTNLFLVDGAGNVSVHGTSTLTGLATANGGIAIGGGSNAAGVIYKDSGYGVVTQATTGSTADWAILRQTGGSFILYNPTGTANIAMPSGSNLSVGGQIQGTNLTMSSAGSGFANSANAQTQYLYVQNTSTGTSARAQFSINNSADGLVMAISSTGYSGAWLTSGPTGESAGIYTGASIPLVLGTNNTAALSLTAAQLGQWGAAEADKFTSLTYTNTISVNPALGNTFETTTINATGSATINFLNAGTAGQQVKLIIINDATSGKTMTWGTYLRPASSTLVGVASKASTIVFQSDGTSFFELSRETGNL